MSGESAYQVVFTSAAKKGMNSLPESEAAAMFEHLQGPVSENPYRLGKQLNIPLDDFWATRRGEYRALYTIDEEKKYIVIMHVSHRRDTYRTH